MEGSKAMSKRQDSEDYVVSSGNVFADLGLPNSEEELLKAELAYQITTVIRRSGLTQAQAAKAMRINQPKVSDISRGRTAGYSVERMMRFLVLLGCDVRIAIDAPHDKEHRLGRLTVAAAS
jgi:predicted XRE-type DNA-binding protein